MLQNYYIGTVLNAYVEKDFDSEHTSLVFGLELIASAFRLLPAPFNAFGSAFHLLIKSLLLYLPIGTLSIIATLAFRVIALLRAPMPRAIFLILSVSTGITSLLGSVVQMATKELMKSQFERGNSRT